MSIHVRLLLGFFMEGLKSQFHFLVIMSQLSSIFCCSSRLGIRECGYDDVGVESIKCQLSDILCHVDGPKCNAFAISVVSALVRLHPNGHEEFVNDNIELPGHSTSAIPGILRDCLSRLKSEQASSLLGL